jgi:hypothetical protein
MPKNISAKRPETLIEFISIMDMEVILDWRDVSEIDAAGICILCCLYDSWAENGKKIVSVNINKNLEKIPVVKMFSETSGKIMSLIKPDHFNYQTHDFKIIGVENSITMFFIESFVSKNQTLKEKEELIFTCNLLISELMQNSLDHSSSERYYVYIELNKLNINLGVLDLGVTLPAKLNQKYNFDNSIDAIKLAFQDGITTRRQRAGGKGLFYLYEEIKDSKGSLTFISADAQIKAFFANRAIQARKIKKSLRGTWIFATLPLIRKDEK